jgi:hypothetical protein
MNEEQLGAIRAAMADPMRVPSDRGFDCTQLVQCFFDRAALLAEVDRLTKASLAAESTYMEMVEELTKLRAAIIEASRLFNNDDTTADEIHRVLRAALEQNP